MFGGSALTDAIDVPKGRDTEEMGDGIPVTYVPARNTVFLSFALAWAEVLEADDIFIGVNALDYSGYPDCRPEYIEAYEQMANLATKRGVEGHRLRIHTPLIDLTKAEIIKRGLELGVDYATDPQLLRPEPRRARRAASATPAQLRLKGFAENGLTDPAPYQQAPLHDHRSTRYRSSGQSPQLSGDRDLRADDPGRGRRSRPRHPLRPLRRLRLPLLLVRHDVRRRPGGRSRQRAQAHQRRDRRAAR